MSSCPRVEGAPTCLPEAAPGLAGERLFAALDRVARRGGAAGVAVSGGSDSAALLVAAAGWARGRGHSLRAATVDHGLRPEAAEEAARVALLCERLGVAHDTLTWAPPARRASQDTARMARHGLLAGWARRHGLGAVMLGHTRDDRIETFLIRLRAGSGWWGLAGPMPCAASPVWPEGRGIMLARPLLCFGRDELRGYLRGSGESWVDDPSNANPAHERVRMRSLAARMGPEGRNRIVRTMDRFAEMRAAVIAEARNAMAEVELTQTEAAIPDTLFATTGPAARLRLVEALVIAAGHPRRPPPAPALALIAAMAISGAGSRAGQEVDPGGQHAARTLGGAWIRYSKGVVRISPAPPRGGGKAQPAAWDRAQALLCDPDMPAMWL